MPGERAVRSRVQERPDELRAMFLERLAAAGNEAFRVRDAGADLAGLRLDRSTLERLLPTGTDQASWWDGRQRGVRLFGADLTGVDLDEIDLTGANLSHAVLAGGRARSARFDDALVEEADFAEADLSGASFARTIAGQAKFADAMLEDADFAGATMRFASLSRALLDGTNFTGADLWGAHLDGADADHTSFRNARLDEADLRDANLTFSDFDGASLKKARLGGSRLRGANFNGAKLDGADLSGADLTEANLARLNLATCNLRHARFAGAWLTGTRFRIEQVGGAVGEEVAGEYDAAAASYLALEQNLKSIGSTDEASWAYKQRRRMGRYQARVEARAAWTARDGRGLVRHGYRWLADRFVEWLCDYGESLSRLVRAFALVIVVFAGLFAVAGGLVPEGATAPTRDAVQILTYSALNMLTSNPPEIGIKPIGSFTNLLVGVQGAAGIVLLGLFGFVLGNRLRR